jgi:hypothetical protein
MQTGRQLMFDWQMLPPSDYDEHMLITGGN